MFESMTDRIAGTLLMGLDVAVEFATLGEFRLVEADGSPAPDNFQAAPLVRRPVGLASVDPDQRLLPAASTAIARAAAESAARVAERRKPGLSNRPVTSPSMPGSRPAMRGAGRPMQPGSNGRPMQPGSNGRPMEPGSRAVLPSAPRRRVAAPAAPRPGAHPRKRGGAVEANKQLCLFSR
jgi:hypothetical protein